MSQHRTLTIRTDTATVARALNIAIKNGYDLGKGDPDKLVEYAQFLLNQGVVMAVLVQHKFCKALWPKTNVANPDDYRGAAGGMSFMVEEWKGHLQRMVMAKDPIEYLAENI